jgi:hypothetical protein
MATSVYFNNYNSKYSEQRLIEDLIVESIKIMGFDAFYLPITNSGDRDLLYGEDPVKKFKTSFPALILGSAIVFAFGLTWLHSSLELTWTQTISAGLTPFIFGEVIKIAITATSLPLIWRKISQKLAR